MRELPEALLGAHKPHSFYQVNNAESNKTCRRNPAANAELPVRIVPSGICPPKRCFCAGMVNCGTSPGTAAAEHGGELRLTSHSRSRQHKDQSTASPLWQALTAAFREIRFVATSHESRPRWRCRSGFNPKGRPTPELNLNRRRKLAWHPLGHPWC